eukprot:2022355-Prymnesium_polylepis.1
MGRSSVPLSSIIEAAGPLVADGLGPLQVPQAGTRDEPSTLRVARAICTLRIALAGGHAHAYGHAAAMRWAPMCMPIA